MTVVGDHPVPAAEAVAELEEAAAYRDHGSATARCTRR
jgi:hypothetical protein